MDSCKVKKNMKKILAFTLAEVLISLTILGVIAALTIPVIMNNSQQKANAIAYRRIITVLNETVERSVAETRFLPQPRCFYWDKNPYGGGRCVEWTESGDCKKYELSNSNPLPSDYNGRKYRAVSFFLGDGRRCESIWKIQQRSMDLVGDIRNRNGDDCGNHKLQSG